MSFSSLPFKLFYPYFLRSGIHLHVLRLDMWVKNNSVSSVSTDVNNLHLKLSWIQVLMGKIEISRSEEKWKDFRVGEGTVQKETCLGLLLAVPELLSPQALAFASQRIVGRPTCSYSPKGSRLAKSMLLWWVPIVGWALAQPPEGAEERSQVSGLRKPPSSAVVLLCTCLCWSWVAPTQALPRLACLRTNPNEQNLTVPPVAA